MQRLCDILHPELAAKDKAAGGTSPTVLILRLLTAGASAEKKFYATSGLSAAVIGKRPPPKETASQKAEKERQAKRVGLRSQT